MTARSWVVLYLDTMQPEIEIFAPNYTTTETQTIITIESSENLSDYQEFYAIDSNGIRHDYAFLKEDDNTFIGRVRFNNVPLGHIILFARVSDEVGNMSALYQKTIDVRMNVPMLRLEMNEQSMNVDITDSSLNRLDTTGKIAVIETVERVANAEASEHTMQSDTKISIKREG